MDVVVVDDMATVRAGLVMLLGCAPGIRVVGEAADGAGALALIAAQRPDVVVMDVAMPDMDGIAATRSLRRAGGRVPVVLLSVHSDALMQEHALAAGASALVAKCDGPSALLTALRELSGAGRGEDAAARGREDRG